MCVSYEGGEGVYIAHATHKKVRGQVPQVSSLLLPCGFWEANLGHQV